MKKKLGPLPTWAWIVLVGGTVVIALYLRSKKAASGEEGLIDPSTGKPYAQEYAESQLAATTGAAGAGAGSAGGGTPAEANAAALASQKEGDETTLKLAQIAAAPQIQAQGLTEAPRTFTQEIEDVSGAVGALSALGSMFQPAKPATAPATTAAAGGPRYLNKATGKMETAAQMKTAKAQAKPKAKAKPKPVRHTVQHTPAPAHKSAPVHATPKPVHVTAPAHRTAPVHVTAPHPAPKKPAPKSTKKR